MSRDKMKSDKMKVHKIDFKMTGEQHKKWLCAYERLEPLLIDHLLAQAEKGNPDAMYQIGQYYYEEKREDLACLFLEEASMRGSLEAEKLLRVMDDEKIRRITKTISAA